MAEKVVNADLTLTRPLKARSGGLGADASAAEWAIGAVPIKNASGGFSPRHFKDLTNQFLYGKPKGHRRSVSWTAVSAPPTGSNNNGASVSLGTVGAEQTSSPAISFWPHIDPLALNTINPAFEIIAANIRSGNASQSALTVMAYGASMFTLPAVSGVSSQGAYLNTYLNARALTLSSIPFHNSPPTTKVLPSNPNRAGLAFYVQANSNVSIAGINQGKDLGQMFILATQSAPNSPQTQPVKLLHKSQQAQQNTRLLLPNEEDMDMPPFGAAIFMYIGSMWQLIAKNW